MFLDFGTESFSVLVTKRTIVDDLNKLFFIETFASK